MAVKPQASALKDAAPLKSKPLKLLSVKGVRQNSRYSVGLRQTRPILKGLCVWAVCILPRTIFREFALDLLCQTLIALCLIFAKFSKVFPAQLHAIWHLYWNWSHMLLLAISTSIFVVGTLALCQEKCAKTKSTAWPWKRSNNTHSSPSQCILGFLPSFPDLSLLLRTELHATYLLLSCPCPYVATRFAGLPLSQPQSEAGVFQNWRWWLQKNLLYCWLLRSRTWQVNLQLVDCCLGKLSGPTLGLLWNLFYPGQTMLCPPWFQDVSGLQMSVSSSISVSGPVFCNLQIATIFSTLQSGTLQCLKC